MPSISPPNVASAHAAKNSTKNAVPRATRAPRETGLSGSSKSLLEPQVDQLRGLGLFLDHAVELEHADREIDERLVLVGVVRLVRRAVLPRDERGGLRECFAWLLHRAPHHLVGLCRLALDHVERLEEAVDRRLYDLRVLVEEVLLEDEHVDHDRIVLR